MFISDQALLSINYTVVSISILAQWLLLPLQNETKGNRRPLLLAKCILYTNVFCLHIQIINQYSKWLRTKPTIVLQSHLREVQWILITVIISLVYAHFRHLVAHMTFNLKLKDTRFVQIFMVYHRSLLWYQNLQWQHSHQILYIN